MSYITVGNRLPLFINAAVLLYGADKNDVTAGQNIYSPWVERIECNQYFAEGDYWGDN